MSGDEVRRLIEQSSFGTRGARKLRDRAMSDPDLLDAVLRDPDRDPPPAVEAPTPEPDGSPDALRAAVAVAVDAYRSTEKAGGELDRSLERLRTLHARMSEFLPERTEDSDLGGLREEWPGETRENPWWEDARRFPRFPVPDIADFLTQPDGDRNGPQDNRSDVTPDMEDHDTLEQSRFRLQIYAEVLKCLSMVGVFTIGTVGEFRAGKTMILRNALEPEAGSACGKTNLASSDDAVTAGSSSRPWTTVACSVLSAAFAPDGSTLAITGGDGSIRLRDMAVCRHACGDWVWSAAFPPRSALLASARGDGTARVWDAATGAARSVPTGNTGRVEAVAGPDGTILAAVGGTWLASAGDDGTVRDAGTDAARSVPTGAAGRVEAVAFSPDGAVLWHVAAHGDRVQPGVFDPDGTSRPGCPAHAWEAICERVSTILAAGGDGSVRSWDVAARRHVTRTGHRSEVRSVAFSSDGGLLATAGAERVRVWDVATGDARLVPTGHTGWVDAVLFGPAGARLASAGGDGTVRGKTQIAREFAHRFDTDYDTVWWVRSEEPGEARRSLLERLGDALAGTGDVPLSPTTFETVFGAGEDSDHPPGHDADRRVRPIPAADPVAVTPAALRRGETGVGDAAGGAARAVPTGCTAWASAVAFSRLWRVVDFSRGADGTPSGDAAVGASPFVPGFSSTQGFLRYFADLHPSLLEASSELCDTVRAVARVAGIGVELVVEAAGRAGAALARIESLSALRPGRGPGWERAVRAVFVGSVPEVGLAVDRAQDLSDHLADSCTTRARELRAAVEAAVAWCRRTAVANGRFTVLFTANSTLFMGMDLRGLDLSGVDFSQVSLYGVDLAEADLAGADLIGADLTGADLSSARLAGVIWTRRTLWPESCRDMVEAASDEVEDGLFKVRDGTERVPSEPALA
jgi:hypothetical protein